MIWLTDKDIKTSKISMIYMFKKIWRISNRGKKWKIINIQMEFLEKYSNTNEKYSGCNLEQIKPFRRKYECTWSHSNANYQKLCTNRKGLGKNE
jgi:hypothetical protein